MTPLEILLAIAVLSVFSSIVALAVVRAAGHADEAYDLESRKAVAEKRRAPSAGPTAQRSRSNVRV